MHQQFLPPAHRPAGEDLGPSLRYNGYASDERTSETNRPIDGIEKNERSD